MSNVYNNANQDSPVQRSVFAIAGQPLAKVEDDILGHTEEGTNQTGNNNNNNNITKKKKSYAEAAHGYTYAEVTKHNIPETQHQTQQHQAQQNQPQQHQTSTMEDSSTKTQEASTENVDSIVPGLPMDSDLMKKAMSASKMKREVDPTEEVGDSKLEGPSELLYETNAPSKSALEAREASAPSKATEQSADKDEKKEAEKKPEATASSQQASKEGEGKAKKMMEETKEKAQEVKEGAIESGKTVVAQAGEKLTEIKEQVQEKIHEMTAPSESDKAQSSTADLEESDKSVMAKVGEKVTEIKEQVQEKIHEMTAPSASTETDKSSSKTSSSSSSSSETGKTVMEKAGEKAREVKESVKDKAQEIKDKAQQVKEDVKDKAQQVKEDVKDKAQEKEEEVHAPEITIDTELGRDKTLFEAAGEKLHDVKQAVLSTIGLGEAPAAAAAAAEHPEKPANQPEIKDKVKDKVEEVKTKLHEATAPADKTAATETKKKSVNENENEEEDLHQAENKGIVAATKDKISGAVGAVTNIASEVKETVVETIHEVTDPNLDKTYLQLASEKVHNLKDAVLSSIGWSGPSEDAGNTDQKEGDKEADKQQDSASTTGQGHLKKVADNVFELKVEGEKKNQAENKAQGGDERKELTSL